MQISERLNNRYELVRELGDGGFGTTYLVRDHQMPSTRYCVVKQLKPLQDNPQIYDMVKERFQREAAILEQLGEHDQVPRLYAYFSESDLFYLVEEYIEGDTIAQKVQNAGAQPEALVQNLLLNLLPAIAHVHQQKIVHRDIKPDNIVMRQVDQKPVLIDFGAVKETMATVLNAQGDSSRSIVVGTPGYMPSEQTIGRPVYASDLYSLGLTAIYMLTGKMPQDFDTDPHTGAFLWRSHAPQISAGFADFLDRAIQISPAARFSSAQEMLLALNGLLSGATLPPNAAPYQVAPQNARGATIVSAPPENYNSGMPTQVVVPPALPQPVAQQPYSQPLYVAVPSQPPPAATGGEWKKAAMTGGIIGLSILIGALVLKTQTQSGAVANNPAPQVAASPTTAPSPSTASSSTAQPAVPEPSVADAKPEKPPVSAADAAQAVEGTDSTIVGDAGAKNIRSGPGTKYDSPHVAYPGDRVKILASSRDEGGYLWHKVYFPKSGAEGWIANQLLRSDTVQSRPAIAQSASPQASQPNPPVSNPAAETNATIVGQSGSKNIRSGPGTNFDSSHIAYPGDRVKIIDTAQDKGGYTWYKVYFPKSGADGWIAAQLIRTD
jgi:serine/threonine protein kinase, bacterial